MKKVLERRREHLQVWEAATALAVEEGKTPDQLAAPVQLALEDNEGEEEEEEEEEEEGGREEEEEEEEGVVEEEETAEAEA